jgi:hypothetical protein
MPRVHAWAETRDEAGAGAGAGTEMGLYASARAGRKPRGARVTRSVQMLARIAIPILSSLMIVGCGCPTRGSGVRTEVTREIQAFTTLDVPDAIDVVVRVGEAPGAKVVGDDNLVESVETELVGDTLHVRTRGSYITGSGLEVYLTTPSLDRIEVSGSGDVSVDGIEADAMVIESSGSGDVQASGAAKTLTIAASGSGDVDASRLTADDVKVNTSGSGDARVHANETLDATISGSGEVRYHGDPEVTQAVSGSGDVRRF